jgi:hypothetical protein
MTLDASGNLGVGTTSPSGYGKLTVGITGTATPTNATNLGPNSINLAITSSNTDVTAGVFGWQSSGPGIGSGIGFSREDGTNWGTQVRFYTHPTATTNFGDVTERARIDSSGNLLVGATSTGNAHILQTATSGVYATQFISSTASSPFGNNINFSGAAPNGTSNQFLYCNDSSALRMEVRSNGGIANYTANNVNLSDRREKTNFAPAKSYLETICAIPVQTFNYIDQNMEEDGGLTLGVVAQDVQAVAPELVMESNWASKDQEPKMRLSIYQTDLQYALMKCIQEQQAIIESLKARLDAANL